MKVKMRCPICGKITCLEVTPEVYKKYQLYQEGYGMIQQIPLPANEREFLKTGICMKCQEFVFAEPDEEVE